MTEFPHADADVTFRQFAVL